MSKTINNGEIKKQYFIDYWKDFTRYSGNTINQAYFSNLEQDSINPILYNPKELFQEFIDEIERKNLSNHDNKKFFIENVNNLIDLKLEALKFLESTLKIIQQQFNKKDDFSYLLYALKFALSEMTNFRLGKECVKELAEILCKNKSLENKDKETIKHLVNFIVFELQNKGFSIRTIHTTIINNILDTAFPHNFEPQKEYTQENKEQSLADRIKSLENYFNRKAFVAKFIFRVNGIRGIEKLQVGDIEIYNPIQKKVAIKKISDPEQEYDETFGLNDAHQSEVCNIIIKENIIDIHSELEIHKAILKANSFLNCLVSRNFGIKTKISIDTTYCIVLDDKNQAIGEKYTAPEDVLSYRYSQRIQELISDTKDNYLQYYAKLTKQNGLIEIDRQIERSLAWKRKSLESANYNEAILWCWVSIENLFNSSNNTTKTIFHFAPKILTKAYIHHFMQQIHQYISDKTLLLSINNSISKETQKIIQNMPNTMTYKEFIENAKEIQKGLDKNSLFHDRLKDFIEIFEDNKQFKNFIENYKKQTDCKLTFLYRLRNKIAHNASNDYNVTIAYYNKFASFINTILICYFIDKRLEGLESNEEIIHYGKYEYDKMFFNLEKYGVSSIINPKECQ